MQLCLNRVNSSDTMKPLDILRNLTALYVEDDPVQRGQLTDLLGDFFQDLLIAENGVAGLRLFDSRPVHLVIADIRMPEMNGLEMAAAIRQRGSQVPILITSAYTDTEDLLAALRLHSFDYLIKPLSWKQLKDALYACANQIAEHGGGFVQLDHQSFFFPDARRLHLLTGMVGLSRNECALLTMLSDHRGQWVSREQLSSHIYGCKDVSEAALKNLVLRLRRKLGDDLLVTRYGEGYKLLPLTDA